MSDMNGKPLRNLSSGTVVWAKNAGFPFWPAVRCVCLFVTAWHRASWVQNQDLASERVLVENWHANAALDCPPSRI